MNHDDAECVLAMAELASAAYDDSTKIVLEVPFLEKIRFLRDDQASPRGFVAIAPRGVVVSIKGTDSLGDAQSDANIAKVPYYTGRVHAGFFHEFSEVWDQVKAHVVELFPQKPSLFVTGHSLGGAVATLMAAAIAAEMKTSVRVVTFGSPRVGDAEFASFYNALVPDTTRVVHDKDLVPRVPVFGFEHVAGLLHLTGTGRVIGATETWLRKLFGFGEVFLSELDGEALRDHFITAYLQCVKGLAKKSKRKIR